MKKRNDWLYKPSIVHNTLQYGATFTKKGIASYEYERTPKYIFKWENLIAEKCT